MSVSFQPCSGKNSKVVIGGYSPNSPNPEKELPFRAFAWDGAVEPLDFTGAGCNGFHEIDAGLKHLSLVFLGVWNKSKNPFRDGSLLTKGMKLGTKVDSINAIINGVVVAYTPSAIVMQWRITSETATLVEFICSLAGSWRFDDFGGTLA